MKLTTWMRSWGTPLPAQRASVMTNDKALDEDRIEVIISGYGGVAALLKLSKQEALDLIEDLKRVT